MLITVVSFIIVEPSVSTSESDVDLELNNEVSKDPVELSVYYVQNGIFNKEISLILHSTISVTTKLNERVKCIT